MSPAEPDSSEPVAWAAAPNAELSPAEVSALLEARPAPAGGEGIRAYFQKSSQDARGTERLPMLEIVLDRFVRSLNTTMRNLTSENVDLSMDNVTSARFGDHINGLALPALVAILRSQAWRNYAVLSFEASLIYAIVDVLLGGRRGGDLRSLEGRSFTTIERKMVERLSRGILGDLNAAFAAVADPQLVLERVETNPKFAMMARPDNPTVVASFRFYMEDRGGKFSLALPSALLYPVREVLAQPFVGEETDHDSSWATLLSGQALAAEVPVEVVLDVVSLTLEDVMAWRCGTTVDLTATVQSPVEVRIAGIGVWQGTMGRIGPKVAVRLA